MNKIFNLFFIIILCSGCSFNKNSKFWTSEKIQEIEEKKFEKIIQDFTDKNIKNIDEKVLSKEKEIMTI